MPLIQPFIGAGLQAAGFQTPAFVNGDYKIDNGSSATLALPAKSHTAGNLIVVAIKWEGSTVSPTVTDTAGNTYYPLTRHDVKGNDLHAQMFYAKNITGNASNVVTISGLTGTSWRRAVVLQYSGIDKTSPLDQENWGFDNGTASTAISTGNITTTVATELLVGFASEYSPQTGYTPGTGFTERIDTGSSGDACAAEDRVVTSIGTYNASMTQATSGDWIMLLGSFKAASL